VADTLLYQPVHLLNATGAFLTLLDIMLLPAVLMIATGAILWRRGWLLYAEDKSRLGRMLLMFGIILLLIVLTTSYFLSQLEDQTGSSSLKAVGLVGAVAKRFVGGTTAPA
jgi:hypothetical protein